MEEDKKNSIITQKDILILKELLEDGRKSSSCISKEIDLGREIVNYRIKRLIKENLIVKFIPKINEKALHYNEYLILLKLNLEDELSKEKFIKEAIGNKYLVWIVKSNAGWDLIIRLYAQSIDEFKEKLNEILSGYSEVLAGYYTIINSEEIKESEREKVFETIFNKNITKPDYKIIKNNQMLTIDSKDKEILNLLETDARAQYKEISEKLNISSDTVKYRIERMKQQGIIENIVPIINFNKLGLKQNAAIINFSYLNHEEETKLQDYLHRNPEITKAIKSLGSFEYFITIVSKTSNSCKTIKTEIEKLLPNKISKFDTFTID